MKLSIREARARFSEAIAAAERGERVVITRHGKPVVELAIPRSDPVDAPAFLDRLAHARTVAGLAIVDENPWPPEMDDPAFSRAALRLDDDDGHDAG
ncbi:type II toxin-antitoxin system prevent-host-death family antitoxin [Sphingomonas sp. SFZ2018-12]|uniref:type II toxin-antitoxin system Phd/YefM family antitoxin n=1 Tax=Sphingomonas sp. SFZ2018-12 TaxID=2683197 RepID=UPI001F0CED49|nr:type II toxin-antitoxin system prevent-host-death family antitoxin [Sphingomonas sp. SFZ2018-12]MCH4892023.1 type II toxin-antitoxin system prevent-host-death family antitoxin [Sphingomonas sp. SFZ2018-12]